MPFYLTQTDKLNSLKQFLQVSRQENVLVSLLKYLRPEFSPNSLKVLQKPEGWPR